MIYSGEFYSTNKILYEIRITTNSGNQKKSVTLGGSPIEVSMDADGKVLYAPAKYQSATISIITPNYNFDIYSAKALGTKVELLEWETGKVIWTGYVTPNLYDMGFDEAREEILIECIDALSTLQYIKYTTEKKSVVTFLDVIRKLLKSCGSYTNFYVSTNVQLTKGGSDTILDKLYISEENFFDEKEDLETDEDVAWTMQDVLEEICLYLGYTAIADGDSVYFLDYDAIKAGNNTYYKYEVEGNNAPAKVTISLVKNISAKDYSESGNSLSLDNVYNKVTISDDLYTFDTVIPDIFGTLENITKSSDSALNSSENANIGAWGEVILNEMGNTNTANQNMIVMIDRVYNPQKKEYGAFNAVFVKYFNNPYYKFFKYNSSGLDITDSVTQLNYTDTRGMYGATIAKFDVRKLDNSDTYFLSIIRLYLFGIADKRTRALKLDLILADNDVTSVGLNNYIMLLNPPANHISNNQITNYPYFQTKVTDTSALFGGKNAHLIISGSVIYHYMSDDPYPIPEGECDIAEGRFAIDDGEAYLLARLLWGNLFWNGSEWVTTASTFKIPFIKEGTSKGDRRADATMYKSLDIVNNVNWRIGTDKKGYLISMPNDEVISGLPILTIYKPFDPNFHSTKSGDNKGLHYKFNCVFLKDFDIKAIVGNPTFSDDTNSDTVYTNIINGDFVNELSEIKFKVCTWDNKEPNYSAVAYKSGNSLKYLDKTFNNSCYAGELTWSGSDVDAPDASNGLRQEEHLIYKLVNQYSTPSIVLKLNLRNDNKIYGLFKDAIFNGREFIVDTINIDYKNNQLEIKLIEKK